MADHWPSLRALKEDLHLAVSMRSFRAENVSAFVKALLDREEQKARAELASLANATRLWLRATSIRRGDGFVRARGTERFGLVASSRAQRLKPHAIDVRVDVDPVQWFLNERDDTRSSYYLEDAATDFQVQGLELDGVRYLGCGPALQQFRLELPRLPRQPLAKYQKRFQSRLL